MTGIQLAPKIKRLIGLQLFAGEASTFDDFLHFDDLNHWIFVSFFGEPLGRKNVRRPSSGLGAIDLTLELDERQREGGHGCDAILEWHAGFQWYGAQSCLKNVHGSRVLLVSISEEKQEASVLSK